MKQDIYINGDIGGDLKVNLEFVREQVDPNATELFVYINSNGGEVDEGFAIYNFLKNHKAKVTTIVESYAYSIASIVFMSGDKRIMHPYSKLMIHNPWGGIGGDSETISRYAKMLKDIENTIVKFYNENTGISKERIAFLMKNETYIDAFEAQALNFSTGVTDQASKIAAKKNVKAYAKFNYKQNKTDKMNLNENDKNWIQSVFNSFFNKYGEEKKLDVKPVKNLFTIMGDDGETEMYINGTIEELVGKRVFKVVEGEVTEEMVDAGVYVIKSGDGTVNISIDEEGIITEAVKEEAEVETPVEEVETKEDELSEVQLLRAEMDEMKEMMKALVEDKEKTKAEMETIIKEKEEVEMKIDELSKEKEKMVGEKKEMIEEMKNIQNKVLGGDKPKSNYKDEVKPKTKVNFNDGFLSMLSADRKEKLNNKIKQ